MGSAGGGASGHRGSSALPSRKAYVHWRAVLPSASTLLCLHTPVHPSKLLQTNERKCRFQGRVPAARLEREGIQAGVWGRS